MCANNKSPQQEALQVLKYVVRVAMADNDNNNNNDQSKKRKTVEPLSSPPPSNEISQTVIDNISVINFPQGFPHFPSFFVDYCDVSGNLKRWLHSLKTATPPYTHLTINGLVKMGKTAVLSAVLPFLIREVYPDAVIFELDFLPYSRVSALEFLTQFYASLVVKANELGVSISATCDSVAALKVQLLTFNAHCQCSSPLRSHTCTGCDSNLVRKVDLPRP